MSQASRISDRTAFFLQGELIEFDKTKKIFLDPAKTRNRRLYFRKIWLEIEGGQRCYVQFEEELLNLHNQFYEMGMMVSSAVHKSVRSYIDHDKKLAQEVIDHDIEINDMEVRLRKKFRNDRPAATSYD